MSLPNAWPAALTPLLVQHHELLGDLAHRAAHAALGLAKSAPPRRCSVGASPPTYWRSESIWSLGTYSLSPPLYAEQQVVALDPADRALDHALVLADAVLVVHDVVAGLEVLEEAGALALAWSRLTVCAAPAGEVALGDDRQLGLRERAAAVQRRDDDVPAGLGEIGRRRGDGEVEAAVAQQLGEPLRRPSPSAATTTRYLSASSSREALGQPLAVADDRAPAAGAAPSARRVSPGVELSVHIDCVAVEQPVGVGVQARERARRRRGPTCEAERAGEIVLLGEQVVGAVAHPPRLDQHDLAGRPAAGR